MKSKLSEKIDAVISDFAPFLRDVKKREHEKPITIWIPAEYQQRYSELQAESKHKFGKLLKEVIKKTIDQVD